MRLRVSPGSILVLGIAAMAYVAPWTFLLQALAWTSGESTAFVFGPGLEEWSARTLWLALFGAGACLIGARERWLGVAVGIAGLQTFWFGPRVTSAYFLVGALVIYGASRFGDTERHLTRQVLGASGLVQAGLVFAQASGLWSPYGTADRVGTLGVTGLCGAYLVMTTFLLPRKALVVMVPAVLLTSSVAAIAGLIVGLCVRECDLGWAWLASVVLATTVGLLLLQSKGSTTGVLRYEVGVVMVREWLAENILLGRGLGASYYAPPVPPYHGLSPGAFGPGAWLYGHSDLLAWITDTGLLGIVALGGWLWSRRRLFLVPSLAALVIPALTWYPLHTLITGMVAALIVGLALESHEGAPAWA